MAISRASPPVPIPPIMPLRAGGGGVSAVSCPGCAGWHARRRRLDEWLSSSLAPQPEAHKLCPGPSLSGAVGKQHPALQACLGPGSSSAHPQPRGATSCFWVLKQPPGVGGTSEKGQSKGRKTPRNVWQTKCRGSTGQEANRGRLFPSGLLIHSPV